MGLAALILSVFLAPPTWSTESKALTRAFTCAELLEGQTHRVVQPWFHPQNPETAHVDLTFLKHKFADAFTYSSDGNYVAIHHDIYPDAEQVSLIQLETGELLSSLIWRGKGERLFDIRSLAIDGESRQIVGFAENFFTDKTDAVLVWDGKSDGLVEHVEVQPPQPTDYIQIPNRQRNNVSYRTDISLDHPYIFSSATHGGGWNSQTREFNARIINWKTKQLLNLPELTVGHPGIPINSRFGYFALKLNDNQTLRIRSFADIQIEMQKKEKQEDVAQLPPTKRFLTQARAALSGLWQRTSAPAALSLPAPDGAEASSDIATLPDFHSELSNGEPILSFQTSNWAPFVVTHTSSGLHVWNAKTGQLIQDIPGEILHFRVLENMSTLAYRRKNGVLVLHSLFENRVIGEFSGIRSSGEYVMRRQLENWQPGVAYITTDDGEITRVTETKGSGLPTYEVEKTGLKIPMYNNVNLRSVITTAKGDFLVQVSNNHSSDLKARLLTVEIYSFFTHQRVAKQTYPMHDFHSQTYMDPKRLRVLYTAGESETGILSLPKLLQDLHL